MRQHCALSGASRLRPSANSCRIGSQTGRALHVAPEGAATAARAERQGAQASPSPDQPACCCDASAQPSCRIRSG
eukprot:1421229-Pleurochrysis_carterae.AAC.2